MDVVAISLHLFEAELCRIKTRPPVSSNLINTAAPVLHAMVPTILARGAPSNSTLFFARWSHVVLIFAPVLYLQSHWLDCNEIPFMMRSYAATREHLHGRTKENSRIKTAVLFLGFAIFALIVTFFSCNHLTSRLLERILTRIQRTRPGSLLRQAKLFISVLVFMSSFWFFCPHLCKGGAGLSTGKVRNGCRLKHLCHCSCLSTLWRLQCTSLSFAC